MQLSLAPLFLALPLPPLSRSHGGEDRLGLRGESERRGKVTGRRGTPTRTGKTRSPPPPHFLSTAALLSASPSGPQAAKSLGAGDRGDGEGGREGEVVRIGGGGRAERVGCCLPESFPTLASSITPSNRAPCQTKTNPFHVKISPQQALVAGGAGG